MVVPATAGKGERNMSIDLTCSCGKRLRVTDEHAGTQGLCPACGKVLEIPEQSVGVSGAGPSLVEAGQAVTSTPRSAGPVQPGSPEYAATLPLPEPAEWMPEEAHTSRPGYKLFPPDTIGLVAFFAGPVGAFTLLALNYWRMGKRGAARITIAVGLVTMALVVAICFALPDSSPSFLIGVPLFLGLWLAARKLQGSAFDTHLRNGGERASGWAALGFALVGLMLFLGVFVGASMSYDLFHNESYGQKIDFGGGNEIYYTKGATEADGRALGAFLRETGFFDGRNPSSVRVSIDGNRLVVAFIVQEWVLRDPHTQRQFHTIGQQAAQRAFGGRPVVVELCDEHFNVKKRL
jgi:hypothetical protein